MYVHVVHRDRKQNCTMCTCVQVPVAYIRTPICVHAAASYSLRAAVCAHMLMHTCKQHTGTSGRARAGSRGIHMLLLLLSSENNRLWSWRSCRYSAVTTHPGKHTHKHFHSEVPCPHTAQGCEEEPSPLGCTDTIG